MNPFRDEYGSLRRPWYLIWSLYRDLANGLNGLYYWVPFAWRWRSWDFQYMLNAVEHCLKAMEPVIRDGIACSADRRAKEIRIALELLRRYREDVHCGLLVSSELDVKGYTTNRQRDWDSLWEIIRKRGQGWWE